MVVSLLCLEVDPWHRSRRVVFEPSPAAACLASGVEAKPGDASFSLGGWHVMENYILELLLVHDS